MSIRAINWVIESFVDVSPKRVTPTMRHILMILANFAGDEDSAYPRQNTIARITGLTRACVNKNLKLMEDIGLLSAEGRVRADGSTRSSEYTIHMDVLNLYDGPVPAEEEDDGVNVDDTGGVNQDDRGDNQDDGGDSSVDTGRQRRRQTGVNQDDTLNHHLKPPPEPKARTRKRKPPLIPNFPLPEGSDFPDDQSFGFDAFIAKYPVRTGDMRNTRQIWFDIVHDGKVKHADIIEGLELYLNKDDFREWCMAQTWLNQERWLERPKQKKNSGMWAGIKGKRVTAI